MAASRLSRPIVLGVLVAAAVGLTGCSAAADRGLTQNDMVVVFAPDVTTAQVAAARKHCNGVAGAKAEKPGPDNAANRANPLRFDVTGLDAVAQAKLSQCLSTQPGVDGFTNDDGGMS